MAQHLERLAVGMGQQHDRSHVRFAVAPVWFGLIVAVGLVFLWLSLYDVAGVSREAGSQVVQTSFVHVGWWMAFFALGVPIAALARISVWLGSVATLVVTGESLGVAYQTIHRYAESGWSDGLENLSFAIPIAHFSVYAFAVLVGAALSQRRRDGLRDSDPTQEAWR